MGERFQEHVSGQEKDEEPSIPLDALPSRLGFSEPAELGPIKHSLAEAMVSRDNEAVRAIVADYYEAGEWVIEELQDDEYGRAQIGLLVTLALIRRDAGRTEDFIEDLDDILEYATSMGYSEAIQVLEEARTEALEALR